MSFKENWKKSKTFRIWTIVIIFIIILFISNYNIQKQAKTFVPQAVCDSALTKSSCTAKNCYWLESAKTNDAVVIKGASIATQTAVGCAFGFNAGLGAASAWTMPIGCIFGFGVGAWDTGVISEQGSKLLDWTVGLFTSPCYSCIQDSYVTTSANNCCSGYGKQFTARSVTGYSIFSKTSYVCYTPAPEDTCSAWTKPISGVVDGLWKGAANTIPSCDGRAYTAIIVLAILMLVI